VSSVMNGESRFDEVFLCSAFSLMPYVLFTLPLALVSHLLGRTEYVFYAIALIVIMVWQVALMFYSFMRLNRYSFWRTVAVAIVSLLVMLLIWAVVVLSFGLVGQLVQFFKSVFTEIQIKSL